jgi:hypothetical protein
MKKNIIILLWIIITALLIFTFITNKSESTNTNIVNNIKNVLIVEIINKEWLYEIDFLNDIIDNNRWYIIVDTSSNYLGDYTKINNNDYLLLNDNYKFTNTYQKDIKMNRYITELYDLNSWYKEIVNLRDRNNNYIQISKLVWYKKNQD